MSADVPIPHPYHPGENATYCVECLALPSDPTFGEHHDMSRARSSAARPQFGTHTAGDPCPVGPFPHPAEDACRDPERSYLIDWPPADAPPRITDCATCGRTIEPSEDIDAQCDDCAADDQAERAAPTADAIDAEEFAAELVAEYVAALETTRDRAIEARYGGRILRQLSVDPKYSTMSDRGRLDLAAELARE